jgi:nitroreductase
MLTERHKTPAFSQEGKRMNVAEAIASRRSVRAFKSSAVEEEKLKRVLEAGRLSPSARNMQDRKFVVVRDKSTREKLMKAAKNQTFIAQAPVVIVACGTIADYVMSCGQLSCPIDVSIAVDHMTLQAVEEGLATCWVCAFSEPDVRKILGIPDTVRVVTLLPMGYPAEKPAARPRNPSEEFVCFEKYS